MRILVFHKWLYYLHQLVYLCVISVDQVAVVQMSEASNAIICRATRVFGKTALRELGMENQRYVCSVTRLGGDWLATSWPRRGSKYSDFVLDDYCSWFIGSFCYNSM